MGVRRRLVSLLAQEEIDDPAAADVLPAVATVGEDVGVVAASVFERVGKDRQVPEDPLSVNRMG
jgi:hypothetical protein